MLGLPVWGLQTQAPGPTARSSPPPWVAHGFGPLLTVASTLVQAPLPPRTEILPSICEELSQSPFLSATYLKSTVDFLYPRYPAAAAAKSLQSCLTLCDPMDGSPPGSPIPGILQAGTLEWVAVSFSSA